MKVKKIDPYPLYNSDDPFVSAPDHDLGLFKNKPFWIWPPNYHPFVETNEECCFNHIVGCPTKNGAECPIYPFQEQIFTALENHQNIWILKSRGVGISTFLIRYLAWKILSSSELDDRSVFIISGTRQEHANYIKQKLQELFVKNFPLLKLESKFTELWLRNTWIKVFPTKNIKDARGYMEAGVIWIDESDFAEKSIQTELMNVIQPYQEKSNCKIILTSTAYYPGGLMQTIEQDPNSKYHKLKLDYSYGLGTIYDRRFIESIKGDPEFKREYECQYGHNLGNVFLPHELEQSITDKEFKLNPACDISLGIDVGFGSSKTAFTVLQLEDGKIQVLYACEFARPEYEKMLWLVSELRHAYKPQKIYVDAANPEFVRSIKTRIGEYAKYEEIIEQANREKANFEYRMEIIPVSFNEHGKELLGLFRHVVSKGLFSINDKLHPELLMQMRTARYLDNANLDKTAAQTNQSTYDLLDSTRLALRHFQMSEKR